MPATDLVPSSFKLMVMAMLICEGDRRGNSFYTIMFRDLPSLEISHGNDSGRVYIYNFF